IIDSPPRIYSNRFTNLHHSTNLLNNDIKSLNLHRRFKDNQYYSLMNDHEKLMKTNEFHNYDENNPLNTSSILVAIVALSCAIILVLLGITVYVCGRRGFQSFRYHHNNNTTTTTTTNNNNSSSSSRNGRMQYLLRNHNSLNNIKLTDDKFNWKNILNSKYYTNHNNNNNTILYPNKSIINNQYHSNQSILFNNENNPYIDQFSNISLKSILIEENNSLKNKQKNHENYTTFLPFNEYTSYRNDQKTLPIINDKQSIYLTMPINNNNNNDELKQNYEKYWIINKQDSNNYTLPQYNQYEQHISNSNSTLINTNLDYLQQSHHSNNNNNNN
ncbi:unnamed protein product, partial [Schistosoma mattheei]